MRSLFLYLFVIILCTACSDEHEDEIVSFELSSTSVLFDCTSKSCDIDVVSNVDWEVQNPFSLPEWLSVFKIDNTLMRVEVTENPTDDMRHSRVYFDVAKDSCFLDVIQEPRKYLMFKDKKEHILKSRRDSFIVEVDANVSFKLKVQDNSDWISTTYNLSLPFLFNQTLIFDIKGNKTYEEREAFIVISNEQYNLTDTLIVKQMPKTTEDITDGEYKVLEKKSDTNASLIVMGDGFTSESLESDHYYDCITEAVEHFFSIEPYKSYREYFNVYMVVAESDEEGVGNKNFFGESSVNNKFGTAFGTGTEIVCNDELIFEYARKVKELSEDKPITVLVVLNSDKYAGTAYLYADGNSIALCPMSKVESPNDFEGIVHHEAGGHAFGFLIDEYVYNQAEMPEERKKQIQEWQKKGYHMNLDFTDDLSKILWKDFIGIEKYAPVGAYEGGYEYQFGVWRCEENSCMNNNIPYYNVQSRWNIVKRIMQLSDIEFSVEDFIKNDNPVYPTGGRALNNWDKFVPLGNPVWIEK